MPAPENLYFQAETKCLRCDGTGKELGKSHTVDGRTFHLSCDHCGATGYVKIRLSTLDVAKAIMDMAEHLPYAPWRPHS